MLRPYMTDDEVLEERDRLGEDKRDWLDDDYDGSWMEDDAITAEEILEQVLAGDTKNTWAVPDWNNE